MESKHIVNRPCRFCGETDYKKLYVNSSHAKNGIITKYHLDLCYKCAKRELKFRPSQLLKYYVDISEVEKAYLAGVIDCDANIALVQRSKGPGYYDQRVTIFNTNKKFIDHFVKHYHGLPYTVTHKWKKGDDKDDGRSPENWKDSYQSVFVNTKARSILEAVYPYLIGKKDQAECIFEYAETILPGGSHVSEELKQKRIVIHKKLRALTKRGKV